jgi:phosphoglycerate kinase
VIRGVTELPLDGKRVLLRVDYNVPLEDRGGEPRVSDDSRIRASLPTVRECLQRNARLIVCSHLGRPKGKPKPQFSLDPVALRLAELIDQEVTLTDEPVGDGVRKLVSELREGQVMMLENLRFDPGEEANDPEFARALASYADVYVNDAFGAAHRAHASTVGVVSEVSFAGAGLLMLREVDNLGRLLGDVQRPYLAILGGAKVSDKIEVLEALLERVDAIVIGGAMANTFLKAQGIGVGKSRVEEDRLNVARGFSRHAKEKGVSIGLPRDALVAATVDAATGVECNVGAIPADQMILDIGSETVRFYENEIRRARTIFWNGPMGVFEKEPFSRGTLGVARAVAANRDAFSVVGGGDSVAALTKAHLEDQISHVSTGGGASLEFIQGLVLPGIAALEKAALR